MPSPFALLDFRKLLGSVATSHLGDQFALIATPWLVMQLGGDAMALGLVLALEGGPRALFMVAGGAFVDRYSPRLVLFVSDLIRLGLTAAMAAVILMGVVEMWMVFVFALGFGVIAGFAVPAGNAMVPMIVDRPQLEAGNATIMGASQIMGFIGPFIAGILLGTFTQALTGVGLAFAIDAVTFAVSALLIWSLRNGRQNPEGEDSGPVWQAVAQAFRFVWKSEAMRLTLLIIAAINFVFVGPMMVGVPVLAEQRLTEGAFAFGLLMSGFAGRQPCGLRSGCAGTAAFFAGL